MIGALVTLDNSYYIVQKHSVFNQYGVKLGWMWTCLIVGPFIWLSSRAHYRDKGRAIIDLLRLAIATLCWYITVWQFGRITQWTSRCDLSIRYSKAECQAEGGVWILGFDISGHCFLMIYSMLVMSEEVVGALVAVFWWRITYHGLYPAGFLQSPIHRIKDSSSKIR
uniref:FIT family protein n=1 Tax=Angiostrongylus cantonensis TaxID=6313 RepID=A0A0K0DGE7_ANGCA